MCNADASFDMMGLEAMIAETPTKKVKRNIKERPQMTPEQSDDIKKRIVKYIKDLPYERVRKCTINGFKEYDPNRFTWEVRLTAPDGYCPAKVEHATMIIALPLSLPHIGVIWTVSMRPKMLKVIATEINWSGPYLKINHVNSSKTTTMITNPNMGLIKCKYTVR